MGCNCGKSRTVGGKKISAVSKSKKLTKIRKRQKICSKCPHASDITRRIVNKRKKQLIKKRCKKLDKLIEYIASNFNYSCPLKKF